MSDELFTFVVTSPLGERDWFAADADHACEQHLDAFPDEPIVGVRQETPS